MLAGRPKLTSPAVDVIIAAVESLQLVAIVTRSSRKDLDYFCKALQACRRYMYETNLDLCSLCLTLFGSQGDNEYHQLSRNGQNIRNI